MQTLRTIVTLAGLALVGASAAHAQTRQGGFSVVLLMGETQSTAPSEAPPPAVRKALADVKDFLPYKSYRVLDTQWSRSGASRMRGPGDQEYDVDITADEIPPIPGRPKEGMLNVIFKLQEVGAATTPGEEFGRMAMAADMEKQRATAQRQLEGAKGAIAQELESRIANLNKQIAMVRARKLIDSRFEMAIGETVVVGTSKLGGGDKGLVVLLTSVQAAK